MQCLRFTLLFCALLLASPAFAATVLENALWRVEVDPPPWRCA